MNSARKHVVRAAMAVGFVIAMAKPASADWLLTPYLGTVFGGPANTVDIQTLDEAFEQRQIFGGSIAGMGGGVFGFEIDFGWSPNFFKLTEGGEDFDFIEVDSSLTTVMGNLVFGLPIGGSRGVGVRPYVTGGLGLMRASIRFADLFDDLSTSDLAVSVGGGAHVFFTDRLGVRGDLRYFRGVQKDEDDGVVPDFSDFGLDDFDFWRASVGVTFRFGG